MAAYRESVAQGGRLGDGAIAHRSRQGAASDAGFNGVDGALSAEASLQTQREPSGCHGRFCGMGDGRVTGDVVGVYLTAVAASIKDLDAWHWDVEVGRVGARKGGNLGA
jgi:hypothetical protein